MLEFYKTYGTVTKKLEQPEPGCWISAVAPTQEDIDFLTNKIGVLPEFINHHWMKRKAPISIMTMMKTRPW